MRCSQMLYAALYITLIGCVQIRSHLIGSPSVHSLDYFIELIEKIERHSKTQSLEAVVNSIRSLVYNDELWNILLGPPKSLPNGALSKQEQADLNGMIRHRYFGPIEGGVVRTLNNETLAMGHVIIGICAGTRHNKRLSLGGWEADAVDPVDNLYAATIAGTIVRTGLDNMNDPSKVPYGPGGLWRPNEMCPQYYVKSAGPFSSASNAQILGDLDGFILGYTMNEWTKRGVRLGQLLRMYYSTGICYDSSFVYCNRASKINKILSKPVLFGQVVVFGFPFFTKYQSRYPNLKNSDVVRMAKKMVLEKKRSYFDYIDNLVEELTCKNNKGDEKHCELPSNLVFILDESGSIGENNYQIEKKFVNNIIDSFHISPYQTRVAVVEYSDEPNLAIKLDDYGSKTKLKCTVDSLVYRGGPTHTGQAIQMVNDQILLPEQRSEFSQGTNSPQIVVLLTDGKSNDANSNILKRAVTQIKRDIKDLTMIAVGVGQYDIHELRYIATDPAQHVFEATDFSGLIELVTSLKNRTCTTPVIVDVDFHPDSSNESVISTYVSPNQPRYFIVPSERFLGLRHLYIEITPIYGTVSLYASRDIRTPGPQHYTYKMDPLEPGKKLSFYLPDPCQGYNNSSNKTCPDLYLTIFGNSSTFSCSEQSCILPNQIKFIIKRGSRRELPDGSGIDSQISSCQQTSLSISTTLCVFVIYLYIWAYDVI